MYTQIYIVTKINQKYSKSTYFFQGSHSLDSRKRERDLTDKLSQMTMEMESLKLRHSQEKNEILRNTHYNGSGFDGGLNNAMRNYQRDAHSYESNIDRLNKNISSLQNLNSGLKNDRLREFLEDVNELKKEMQRYVLKN